MANEQNLKHFKKGHEKLGGKKKGYRSWKTIIEEIMAKGPTTPEEIKKFYPDDKYTAQEIAVMAQAVNSMKGDLNATKWLSEVTEGKPNQSIDANITQKNKLPEGLTKAELLKLAKLDAEQ